MAGRPHKKRGEIEHSVKSLKKACEEKNIRVYANDTAAKLFVQLYPDQPIPAKLTKKRKPRKKVAADSEEDSVSGAEEEHAVEQDAAPRPSKLQKTEVFSASVGAQDPSTSSSSCSSSSIPPS